MIRSYHENKKIDVLKVVIINGLVFFMFGYHVHEKAITPYIHLLFVFICSETCTKGNNLSSSNNNKSSNINVRSED